MILWIRSFAPYPWCFENTLGILNGSQWYLNSYSTFTLGFFLPVGDSRVASSGRFLVGFANRWRAMMEGEKTTMSLAPYTYSFLASSSIPRSTCAAEYKKTRERCYRPTAPKQSSTLPAKTANNYNTTIMKLTPLATTTTTMTTLLAFLGLGAIFSVSADKPAVVGRAFSHNCRATWASATLIPAILIWIWTTTLS